MEDERTVHEGLENERLRKALSRFAPAGADWVGSEELTGSLVRAGKARVCFDRASDTVCLMAVQLGS
ncbi:hypothetical protein ACGFX4_24195 [Kitasatospora sp. NPDC048365]|uniref:hypothetical protein n=1 Tax=Kitasatospora sp. NPDC048365 TaxID=3364050 RepID=UPI00372173F2